jgi:hypothetical protein
MNALVVLAISLPASVTAIALASLGFAKKIAVLEQDEDRCDAINPGKKGVRRCVYQSGHSGAHHCPEDKYYYASYWRGGDYEDTE